LSADPRGIVDEEDEMVIEGSKTRGLETRGSETKLEGRLTFLNERKLPAVITAVVGESFEELVRESRESVAAVLRQYGAILFRGFGLESAADFHAAADLVFESGLQKYIGGVSPRGEVMSGVYESTRFPSHLRIPQHNEMAYLPDPPRALAFFCEIEPEVGGETPLADSRLIYELIPEELRAELERSGVSYHRYLYGPRWNLHHKLRNRLVQLHTSWMAAFSTTDPAVVERACAASGSTLTWDREEGAKISNVLPAFRKHPETGEMLWFNQISTFLSSPQSTGMLRWIGYQLAYWNPYRRPFHATFGDGAPITLRQQNMVTEAIEKATVRFRWQRGDLLLVDNFLVTHGRMPYRGQRRILVAIH
jgi:alpha-ketoglutarate-dependent taurine dioxygenase